MIDTRFIHVCQRVSNGLEGVCVSHAEGGVEGRLLPGCQSLEVGTGRYGIGTVSGLGGSGCRYSSFSRFTVFSV